MLSEEFKTQMGQVLWRLPPRQQQQLQEELADHLTKKGGRNGKRDEGKEPHSFIDLEMLPPELGITILSYLNATDLCLASCVWQDLGNDEYLWQGLCKSTWGHCSIYNKRLPADFSYRRLYLQLDEGSLTFNANPQEGIGYFMSKGILVDHPTELAKFIFYTRRLHWKMLRIYLDERRDVLDELVTLHNFTNQFLPNALRDFFRHIHAPEERGEYLETLITKFSHRFCTCNPGLVHDLGLSSDRTTTFDTLDHVILLNRLEKFVGLCGSALSWMSSYLSDRCCVRAVLQSDPAVH
ncbi:F-box only protein 8 isoform X3 [Nothobranchius furzeri]|uniref:Transcript variant X3 n=1 Tax=Nothobranchius furzeri TaxID=105023 RepID=A0A9D3BKE6_NOTFU|nr:transcript variant X3 [Nothobranchius furzeri]